MPGLPFNSFMRANEFASKSKYWMKLVRTYVHEGQKKICVKANDEKELIENIEELIAENV